MARKLSLDLKETTRGKVPFLLLGLWLEKAHYLRDMKKLALQVKPFSSNNRPHSMGLWLSISPSAKLIFKSALFVG